MTHSDSVPASSDPALDPAEPLRDIRYERFAHLRVIGVPCDAAAREAGFDASTLKHRNHNRIDRRADVVARKAFLAGHETAIVRETRGLVRNKLVAAISLDILRDYAVIKTIVIKGIRHQRIVGVDWAALAKSEHSAAITTFKFDRETGVMVEFDRISIEGAIAQLRDMYGLKAPRRTELTGKDGAAIDAALTVRYDISDEPLTAAEWQEQYAIEHSQATP